MQDSKIYFDFKPVVINDFLTEEEIEGLGQRIYEAIQNDEGYVATALLARFNAPFPRLPFERVTKDEYNALQAQVTERCKIADFDEALKKYDDLEVTEEPQDSACSSGFCEFRINDSESKENKGDIFEKP
jgi:ribonucleotide reductase class II